MYQLGFVFSERPKIALAVAYSMPEETKADNAGIFQAGVRMGIAVMVPGMFHDRWVSRIHNLFLFDWLKPQSCGH
ncbi:MAG: hypothetical protein NTAFB09_25130 [Nitrosospira sp.]